MPQSEEHTEIKELLEENKKLIRENNELLHKMRRWAVAGMVLRVVWYAILIGLPFALYFYILEPYFEAFGSSYETFMQGLNELPGLKGINEVINQSAEQNY